MNKKWVWLTVLLAIPIVYAQRFGGSLLGGFGGGYGLFDLGFLYNTYPQWIDFLIFFLIFAGVGRLVFTRWFGDEAGAKAVYLGLGVALAFGGVYYRYLTLELFGDFAFILLMVIGGAALYGLFSMFGLNKWLSIIASLFVMLYGAQLFSGVGGGSYGSNLVGYIPSGIFSASTLGILLVLGAIGILLYLFFQGKLNMPRRPSGDGDGGSGGGGPNEGVDYGALKADIMKEVGEHTNFIMSAVDKLAGQMKGVNQDVTANNNKIEELVSSLNGMQSQLNKALKYEERINQNEDDIKNLSADLAQKLSEETQRLREELSRFLTGIVQQLSNIYHQLSFIRDAQGDLDKKIEQSKTIQIRVSQSTRKEEKILGYSVSHEPVKFEESLVRMGDIQSEKSDRLGESLKIIRIVSKDLGKADPNIAQAMSKLGAVISSLMKVKTNNSDLGNLIGDISKNAAIAKFQQRKLLSTGKKDVSSAKKDDQDLISQFGADFKTLGIRPGASWREITVRYRKLVKIYNPQGKGPDENKFRGVIAAKGRLEREYQKRGMI